MMQNRDQGVTGKGPVFEYEKFIQEPIFDMANCSTDDRIDSYHEARGLIVDSLQVEL